MAFFYGHLFAAEPEIRAMFPVSMQAQQRRFYRALTADASRDYLESLGRAHRKYGVHAGHYPAMRAALLATCRRSGLGAAGEAAALAAFDRAAAIMAEAAEADALLAPAWWTAEVTGHELAAPDVAIVTLRPSPALAWVPGQHVAVTCPRWPRQWRRYSIANAPRADGTISLHVRAVPGGLVSPALVHHTRPGDTLVLGPAEGAMTVDAGSRRDVLCLAGGTGLAPLLAITEAVTAAAGPRAAGPARREVVVYHGARTADGLYGLPALRALAARYPGLKVIAATSADRVPHAVHAAIPDIARRALLRDRDIYVSGPDAMIIATVRALLDAGADPRQLRYDLPG
ncbi:MAG TPA: FAD-binding oxidoreductase [Trebonia sp.]|nr:FAD-binding oxidoreductase [Trebonia sp.]